MYEHIAVNRLTWLVFIKQFPWLFGWAKIIRTNLIHTRYTYFRHSFYTKKTFTRIRVEWIKSAHRHQNLMMTSSNGSIFRVTGPLCGEFTGPGEFPTQRPVTRSFDVFFDLRLNKRLSKQPWGWWFETPAWSLWRHRNDQNLTLMNKG